MDTELIRIDPRSVRPDDLSRAGKHIRCGRLVGFPTETVYGIGVRADDEGARRRLAELKGRPPDKPLAYHIPDLETLTGLVPSVPPLASRLIDRYWPGPLTLVLPGEAGRMVGVRLPGNEVARGVLRAAGVPVVATSANPAGQDPARTGAEVLERFPDRLDCLVDAGASDLGEPSTVVEVQGTTWRVLRAGFLDESAIRRAVTRLVLVVCTGNTCRSPMAAALLRRALAERLGVAVEDLERAGFAVESAGTAAFPGGGASRNALETMREMEIRVEDHRTRRLSPALVEEAELVLAMTEEQRRLIDAIAPGHQDRIHLLDPAGVSIPDPFGASVETYRDTARQLRRAVEAWADRLAGGDGSAGGEPRMDRSA